MANNQMDIILSVKQIGGAAVDQIKNKMSSLKKMTDSLNLGQIMGAAGVVKSLGTYVEAYEESRRATAMLSNSLKNIGIDYKTVQTEVEKTTKSLQEKTNYGDDEQVQALAKLIPLVGSYKNAMQQLPTILDLAAFQQTDLSSAADDFAKLMQGELPRGLAKVMPELSKMKEAGASAGQMIAYVNSKIKDSAQADASPFLQFKNILGDVAEDIGQAILPALEGLKNAFVVLPPIMQKILVLTPLLASAFAVMGGPITLAVGAITAIGLAIGATIKEYDNAKKRLDDPTFGLDDEGKKKRLEDGIKQREKILQIVQRQQKEFIASSKPQSIEEMDNSSEKADQFRTTIQEHVDAIARMKSDIEALDVKKALADQINIKPPEVPNQKNAKEDARKESPTRFQKMVKESQRILSFRKEEAEKQDQTNRDKLDKDMALKNETDEWFKQRDDEVSADMDRRAKLREQRNKKHLEEIKQQNEKNAQDLAQIGASIGMAMSAGFGKGSDGLKESLKAVLNVGIDFIQSKFLTMMAAQLMDDFMSMGANIPIHIAATAAGTAAIQGVRYAVNKFEAGTNYAPGGMALVGERGPELISLPRGSSVMNNTQTLQTINNNNNAPNIVIIKQNTDRGLQKQLERITRNKTVDWQRIMAMA